MILVKVDSAKYKAELTSKLTNYANKAPILISFATSDKGVEIVHENSGKIYTFPWDYTVPVKSFIHMIKMTLSEQHYPRISRMETVQQPLTDEEKNNLVATNRYTQQDVPNSVPITKEHVYMIDKFLVLDDVFIIIDVATDRIYRYKMKYPGMFFLKNYRENKFSTIREAGDFFFEKSVLLNEIKKKS